MLIGLSRKAKTLGCLETPLPFSPKEFIFLIPVGAEDSTVTILWNRSSGGFAADLVLRNDALFPSYCSSLV